MQTDGDDLRIAFWNNATGNWTELDRLVFGINEQATSIWFKTKEPISVNASDLRYYVYYGNDTAANPPENKSNVYFYYEGFDSNTINIYNLTKDFEETSFTTEDANSIIEYNIQNQWVNHTSTSAKGKSMRRYINVDDAIVEVYHYYDARVGLEDRLEIASRINSDTYYYFYIPNNIGSSTLARHNDNVKTSLVTSTDVFTTQDVWYRLTLETYSNDSTVFLKAYVNGSLLLSYNDSATNRITSQGGFGIGEFQTIGRWDNISVRRKVLVEPNITNNREEEFIERNINVTGADGIYIFNFSTANKQFGNYSAVFLAQNPNYFNGYGGRTFEVGPDLTPPIITLNFPMNDFNSSEDIINFNWTADDRIDGNLTCNVTINKFVNATNISSLDNQPTNLTVAGLLEGANFWNITCIDDANNTNTSITRNFTVIKGPIIFNITLASDNESINLSWNSVSYAESYSIYIIDNFTDTFSSIANVSGITHTNYTDYNAANKSQRFYKIAAVKGSVNKTTIKTVGKYEFELINNSNAVTDWNLISLPLNVTNFILNNGSNNGSDLRVKPLNCIKSLWFYNATIGEFKRTDYNGSAWITAAGSENFTSLEAGRGYWAEVNQTCNLTFVGEVPTSNITTNLSNNMTPAWQVVGWYSPNSSKLPTNYQPSYPVAVNPINSVKTIDRYNPVTDKFEVTTHFVVSGSDWGWFPSANNRDFTALDPTRGYYFEVINNATWAHKPNTEKN